MLIPGNFRPILRLLIRPNSFIFPAKKFSKIIIYFYVRCSSRFSVKTFEFSFANVCFIWSYSLFWIFSDNRKYWKSNILVNYPWKSSRLSAAISRQNYSDADVDIVRFRLLFLQERWMCRSSSEVDDAVGKL